MRHAISEADRRFQASFEAGELAPADFGHRAHVRLAYIYLVEHGADRAAVHMRTALIAFLQHHGIDVAAKYHETLTKAWLDAVWHFMNRPGVAVSADSFIDANPTLLDSKIMLSHYSAEVLFSPAARGQFLEPDLSPIPKHGHKPGR